MLGSAGLCCSNSRGSLRVLGAYLIALNSEPRFLSGVILPNRSELKDVFSQIVLLIWETCAPEVVRAAGLYQV